MTINPDQTFLDANRDGTPGTASTGTLGPLRLRNLFKALQDSQILHDITLSAPPATPTEGASYLVAPTGTGAWAGQDNKIATYINGGWVFSDPRVGVPYGMATTGDVITWNGASVSPVTVNDPVPLLSVAAPAGAMSAETPQPMAYIDDTANIDVLMIWDASAGHYTPSVAITSAQLAAIDTTAAGASFPANGHPSAYLDVSISPPAWMVWDGATYVLSGAAVSEPFPQDTSPWVASDTAYNGSNNNTLTLNGVTFTATAVGSPDTLTQSPGRVNIPSNQADRTNNAGDYVEIVMSAAQPVDVTIMVAVISINEADVIDFTTNVGVPTISVRQGGSTGNRTYNPPVITGTTITPGLPATNSHRSDCILNVTIPAGATSLRMTTTATSANVYYNWGVK